MKSNEIKCLLISPQRYVQIFAHNVQEYYPLKVHADDPNAANREIAVCKIQAPITRPSLMAESGSASRGRIRMVRVRGAHHGLFQEHLGVGESVADIDIGEQVDRGGGVVLDLFA